MGESEVIMRIIKEEILRILEESADFIRKSRIQSVQEKGKSNYVTDLDTTIELRIMRELRFLYPDIPFVSEESASKINYDTFWVLDPIDGTTNLMHNFQNSCISLALVKEKEVQFGYVYSIFSGEVYYAEKGEGAYVRKNGEEHPIKVSERDSVSHAMIGFGCPYDKAKIPFLFSTLEKLIAECDDLKRVGPASLDLCRVASGQLDAYLELDLEYWDYAAGGLILTEAGGTLSNWNGEKEKGKSHILASNGYIHRKILEKIS